MLNIKFDNSIIDHEGVMGTCDDVLALHETNLRECQR